MMMQCKGIRRCRRAVLYALLVVSPLLFGVACNSASPEQRAAQAAKTYYDRLAEGYAEGFLEGKVAVDSLPAHYLDALLPVYRQYVSEVNEKHGGIREVRISPNVGRRDSTLQLTYAFLMLCYADSTEEEITVPMVEVDGQWLMK